MKIIFHTNNIDRTFYRQQIHKYIEDQIFSHAQSARRYKDFRDYWEIHIHPAEDWEGIDHRSADTGTLNSLIPHGVTGEGFSRVYIIDVNDKGLTALQNLSAIFHETAHLLLMILMRGVRGTMRNDDLGGLKKGQSINVSTQEVHDRQMEGKLYYVKTWVNFGTWFIRRWNRYTAIGIDLRDFIKANV